MATSPIIVWFRTDLRLADQPALHAAVLRRQPVVPVFIWSPGEEDGWRPGGASRWWLHHSLVALDRALRTIGSRLLVRAGDSFGELRRLGEETGARTIFWNRRYEPAIIKRDIAIKSSFTADGFEVESFNAALLHEPWTVLNKAGKPFQVFTPFWKSCLANDDPPKPLPAPESLSSPNRWPETLRIDDLNLLPQIGWDAGLRAAWCPGESGARRNLDEFVAGAFETYSDKRNRPDQPGTSRLSPHFHFGEISPRQVWWEIRRRGGRAVDESIRRSWRDSQFLAEIGWREFAHHLLYHFPHTTAGPLRPEFRRFPWREPDAWLRAWQRGRTGYPLIDAGLRELWSTGWMHNRVRMVVGSFLVKDLLIDWQEGARWFWDTLVDADLASNTLGWQWVAGCGADAAPYFRIFNPVSQGEKFDPAGEYVRRWVPELAALPAKWIHQPFAAPAEILKSAGVKLGGNYPEPLVNHAIAREVALEAYEKVRAN